MLHFLHSEQLFHSIPLLFVYPALLQYHYYSTLLQYFVMHCHFAELPFRNIQKLFVCPLLRHHHSNNTLLNTSVYLRDPVLPLFHTIQMLYPSFFLLQCLFHSVYLQYIVLVHCLVRLLFCTNPMQF